MREPPPLPHSRRAYEGLLRSGRTHPVSLKAVLLRPLRGLRIPCIRTPIVSQPEAPWLQDRLRLAEFWTGPSRHNGIPRFVGTSVTDIVIARLREHGIGCYGRQRRHWRHPFTWWPATAAAGLLALPELVDARGLTRRTSVPRAIRVFGPALRLLGASRGCRPSQADLRPAAG